MKIARKMLAASVWAATLVGSQTAMAALEEDDYIQVNATGDNQTADVTVCDNFFTPEGCWYMSYNWLGAGEYSIYDLISGTTPVTILVGAADNSLFIDDSGNVGVGTSTPGDTAGSRLTVGLNDLGDSSIFLPTPTANFALVNSGDYIGFGDNDAVSVPFGVDAGSDSSSLWVAPNSKVGVGTKEPSANLHVKVDDDAYGLPFVVENTNGIAFSGFRLQISPTSFIDFNNSGGNFRINTDQVPGAEFEVRPNGDAILKGTLTQESDVNNKQDIEAIDHRTVVAKVMELPISEWSYKDAPDSRHVGPMAQDFYRAFGLGNTDKGITSIDTGGIALAAIQGVKQEKDAEMAELSRLAAQKDARIENLEAQLQEQEDRMMQLELALTELMRQQSSQPRVGSLD
jgi:hypothetical protein